MTDCHVTGCTTTDEGAICAEHRHQLATLGRFEVRPLPPPTLEDGTEGGGDEAADLAAPAVLRADYGGGAGGPVGRPGLAAGAERYRENGGNR